METDYVHGDFAGKNIASTRITSKPVSLCTYNESDLALFQDNSRRKDKM